MEVKNINGFDLKDEKARNEIEHLKNKNRKYIFIGDSYADGYTTSGNVESWIIKTANKLGLTLNESYFKNHLGGTGFVNSTDGKTFLSLLNSLNIENKEEITDIVVLGGFNDKSYDSSVIVSAITEFINSAKEKYPNATIHIGEIGWTPLADGRKQIEKMISECYSKINLLGGRFIKNIQFALHNYEWVTDDYGHPNTNGQESIANHLVEYLTIGHTDVDFYSSFSIGSYKIDVHVHNDQTYFKHPYFTYTNSDGFTLSQSTYELAKLPPIMKGSPCTTFTKSCVARKKDGGYCNVNLVFFISLGGFKIELFEINSSGSNYNSVVANQIQVKAGTYVFSSYDI